MNAAVFFLFSLSFSSTQHVYCSIWDYGYGCGAKADKYMHEQSLAHRERERVCVWECKKNNREQYSLGSFTFFTTCSNAAELEGIQEKKGLAADGKHRKNKKT